MNMHYHSDEFDKPAETAAHYFPGPGDHMAAVVTGKPEFILTPDTNTLLFIGIENGKYVLRPVWQRSDKKSWRDPFYEKWQPTGRDPDN